MILGIDFGASTTDAVLLQGRRIVRIASSPSPVKSNASLQLFLRKSGFRQGQISAIAITGGKSASFRKKVLGREPVHVDEIDAIGFGAAFLAKARRCVAVSMGTGTCIVLFEHGKSRHVIGTGVGGGTITGLSRLLLAESDVGKLIGLAKKGDFRKVDLSVRDIVGKGIGIVPGSATAANFAKGRGSKADIAAAVQNMVAESAAVLAVAAARQCGCSKVVFVGKAFDFPLVRKRLRAAANCFGAQFSFPKNGEVATAIGAALVGQKRKGVLG